MRVLITGGLGFIGRHLQLRLLEEPGTEVSLLDRQIPAAVQQFSAAPDEASGVAMYEADLRDEGAVRRVLQIVQPQVIFHLAAVGVGDPFLAVDKALSHNLYGTLNLLRAAFEAGDASVRRLVISRTPGEFSAMNPYAASKAAAWQFCRMYARTHGWPIAGAAIFQAYGPGQPRGRLVPSAIEAALAGQDFAMTAGDQERDWIYVSDVIAGLLAARDTDLAPGTTIDLGSGEMTSLEAVVEHVFALVGGPGRPRPGALSSRPGEEAVQRARTRRTHKLTGWRTAVSLEKGLSATVDHMRAAWPPSVTPIAGQ